MADGQEKKAVYFGSLTVEGVKCFKGKETLDLTDADGKPAMLTVILGNNGTGKTTLLTCLLGMMPMAMNQPYSRDAEEITKDDAFFIFPFRASQRGFPRFLGITYTSYIDNLGHPIGGLPEGRIPFAARTNERDIPAMDFDIMAADLLDIVVLCYGAGRQMGKGELLEEVMSEITFLSDERLINAQEYLARLDYAKKSGNAKAETHFCKIEALLQKIIPNFSKISGQTNELVQNFIEVEIENVAVPLGELSMGYKTMLAMITDIAKSMLAHYPDSKLPFQEPAVILIDEIDLHLHPSWQQRILNDLTTHFPNVQFIVTTHSPLVLQSAEKVNLAVLHASESGVTIKNYKDTTFSGWSPEEILHDLMELDHTHSEIYGKLMKSFKEAVVEDKYLEAKAIFDELDKILHPNNVTRRLLKLDLASLTPPEVA